jgi:hypothetical protein
MLELVLGPLLRGIFPRLPIRLPVPGFVAVPLEFVFVIAWFLVYAFGGVLCAVLVVCQLFVMASKRIAPMTMLWTGITVACACLGWLYWFSVEKHMW